MIVFRISFACFLKDIPWTFLIPLRFTLSHWKDSFLFEFSPCNNWHATNWKCATWIGNQQYNLSPNFYISLLNVAKTLTVWSWSANTSLWFVSFFIFEKPIPSPRLGTQINAGNNILPENALDALLDELQTFAKPSLGSEVSERWMQCRLDGSSGRWLMENVKKLQKFFDSRVFPLTILNKTNLKMKFFNELSDRWLHN